MAVESQDKFFFPKFFLAEEDKKGNPDLISFTPFNHFQNPRLISSYPNIQHPNLMWTNTNPNYCDNYNYNNNNYNNNYNYCDDNSDGSERVQESAIEEVRSVAAGILLKRYDEVSVFTPLDTRVILGYLNGEYLLSELEKNALLEVGANLCGDEDSQKEENQMIKLALNHALLLIEADTGAISCYPAVMAHNKEKTVFVMSIQPDKLIAELSPLSLRFDNLRMSSHDLFPDLQQRDEDRQKELREMARAFKI